MISSLFNSLSLLIIMGVTLCVSALAGSKDSVPLEVMSAKSIYLVNETGNQSVLDVANDQFRSWGRFTIATSKDESDLVIVFSHMWGMDKWGNVRFTKMEVFVKGHTEPAFTSKDAVQLITVKQHPTKACIADFKKRVLRKH